MQQKLIIKNDISLDDLKKQIEKGSRFIILPYCVSILFAVTLRLFSPAILVEKEQDLKSYKYKYNLLTLIFGWWGFPWGPIYSIRSLKATGKGGVDTTEDIMLNIDEDSLKSRIVELTFTNQQFGKPIKSDIKAFKRALVKEFDLDYSIRKIVVGQFINSDENVPPFIIGFKTEKNIDSYTEKALAALAKEFMNYVKFDFIVLNESSEEIRLFEMQGEVILER